MDIVTKQRRSEIMGRIGGKNTKPELLVRRHLHGEGFRYRLHPRDVPGRPDIVLKKHRAVILVHGCFWHRHASCKYAYSPKSDVDKWTKKFQRNVERDTEVMRLLRSQDWRVLTVWECALTRSPRPEVALRYISRWILSGRKTGQFPK